MAKYIPKHQWSYLTKTEYHSLMMLIDRLTEQLKVNQVDYVGLTDLHQKLDQVKWNCERIDRIHLVCNEPQETFDKVRAYPQYDDKPPEVPKGKLDD